MKDVARDTKLIARCGLYCGACRSYRKGKCPGCAENTKASWCAIRKCCAERSIGSCAECTEFADPRACKKFHNLMARVFGVVFNSDRRACVLKLREVGAEGYVEYMVSRGWQTIPRGG